MRLEFQRFTHQVSVTGEEWTSPLCRIGDPDRVVPLPLQKFVLLHSIFHVVLAESSHSLCRSHRRRFVRGLVTRVPFSQSRVLTKSVPTYSHLFRLPLQCSTVLSTVPRETYKRLYPLTGYGRHT